jgi:hypothetical protein
MVDFLVVWPLLLRRSWRARHGARDVRTGEPAKGTMNPKRISGVRAPRLSRKRELTTIRAATGDKP